MATVSFDKNVVIKEPEAVSILVNSLLNDKPRTINKQLVSESEREKGELLLVQCFKECDADAIRKGR